MIYFEDLLEAIRQARAVAASWGRGLPRGWMRNDSIRLGEIAMQAGLRDIGEAEEALMIGARMLAHGFTGHDLDRMIYNHYRDAAERSGENT